MNRFNAITTALFDPLLAPFGDEHAWFDLIFWSVAGGIVALIVYKYVSNQAGIQRAKNAIKVHLLEIRLFKDDIAVVLGATARILLKNALYLGWGKGVRHGSSGSGCGFPTPPYSRKAPWS